MYRHRIAWLACTTGLLSSTIRAQDDIFGPIGGGWGGWITNQVNSTLCQWGSLRVATLKDVVYLDGGDQRFVAGLSDGTISAPLFSDDNPLGLIWTYNFSTPFDKSTNFSSILGTLPKGAATSIAPNYEDGALLANDAEFFLYGGMFIATSTQSLPDGKSVLGYMASEYNDNGRPFHVQFRSEDLPDGMTRFVTFGAGANAPSENKAWYFGGYRSESWGQIYIANSTTNPTNVSNTFMTLDMAVQQQEVWTNTTLPVGTQSRAGPSMVWVPVGEQGILVVVGGVTYPGFDNDNGTSQNEAQSKIDSPSFMSTIDVYDVAGDKWYRQPTQGAPPALTRGCAVVATAQDKSSFNIYYYGGYDGISTTSDFNDDVWVLTLPSFMWMKVSGGTPEHARAGHQCVMPYPDQMITIGGSTSTKGDSLKCLDGESPSVLQAYNLTQAAWMDSYDPKSWDEYGVPEMIHMMIGGSYSGGATMTAPSPGGWATPALGSVFGTPYNTSKITTYYPYSSVGPGNGTRDAAHSGGGGGTPGWVGAVIGVVLGVALITAVVVGIILYRKRKFLKKNNNIRSDQSTDDNGNSKVKSWMQNMQGSRAPTVDAEDARTQFDGMESRGVSPGHPEMGNMYSPAEMPDTPLVPIQELMGDSPRRAELSSDTGSIHNAGFVDPKQNPFASNPNTPHSITTPTTQFPFGSTVSHDHASSIGSQGPPPRYTQRPDSPPLGTNDAQYGSIAGIAVSNNNSNINNNNSGSDVHSNVGGADTRPRPPAGSNPNRNTVLSGVSGFSDRDAGHMRQASDTTVSSVTVDDSHQQHPSSYQQPQQHQGVFDGQNSPPLPVSPPSVDTMDGANDYISHQHSQHSRNAQGGSTSSPNRQSNFIESEDDLGPGRGEAR
ncbi:uncharacterized protein F4807DRAFT_272872 [Annulohypoxylon truncatum]|uniref:uncharacterized protein n=1 Tax=Annulohypoxylon truncatum TaxID=327061 RepID=UPI002008ADF3|nr:uncharacterized protein F4807DRAFT_272872 [Annulohypoxylon truncatum]KAI1205710.1 hypothetical protein F4807DRAFT_272872 [Annulohypoxylon truncatum]